MAQLIVRNLEDDVKLRFQVRARRHGRSTEEVSATSSATPSATRPRRRPRSAAASPPASPVAASISNSPICAASRHAQPSSIPKSSDHPRHQRPLRLDAGATPTRPSSPASMACPRIGLDDSRHHLRECAGPRAASARTPPHPASRVELRPRSLEKTFERRAPRHSTTAAAIEAAALPRRPIAQPAAPIEVSGCPDRRHRPVRAAPTLATRNIRHFQRRRRFP